MSQPVPEAHRDQLHTRASEGVGLARKLAGRGHVLERGHGGDEMEGLEDDADVPSAEPGETVLVQRGEVVSGHRDLPAGRPLEPADDHEERGLPRTGGPHDAHRLPGREFEVDAAQDLHRAGRAGQCDVEIPQRYDGPREGVIRHGGRFPSVQAAVGTVFQHTRGGEIQWIRRWTR